MYRFQGRDIREVVNRKDWQELRKSFLGTWKSLPKENVKKLKGWLEEKFEIDRYVIVYNYLTGSGFRSGIITHKEIDLLRDNVLQVLFQHKVFRAKPISLNNPDYIGNNYIKEGVKRVNRTNIEKQLIFGGM